VSQSGTKTRSGSELFGSADRLLPALLFRYINDETRLLNWVAL
jgi:hypothetical protein